MPTKKLEKKIDLECNLDKITRLLLQPKGNKDCLNRYEKRSYTKKTLRSMSNPNKVSTFHSGQVTTNKLYYLKESIRSKSTCHENEVSE